jgi:hypothetical protein
MRRLQGIVLLLLLGSVCLGCAPLVSCDLTPAACTRVLFIGNSFTYTNDLPRMFVRLAAAGGHAAAVDMVAPGGWTLLQHAGSADTLEKIADSKWDDVVLQEQSLVPAVAQARDQQMAPAAAELVARIRAAGARPIFFMTWARRDGWPEQGFATYAAMQFEIERAYLSVAGVYRAPVAPVGAAWLAVRTDHPDLELWQADGSHPAPLGTYLAACVFYAVIYRDSPAGLSYVAGLPPEAAQVLQAAAATAVLSDPQKWDLP